METYIYFKAMVNVVLFYIYILLLYRLYRQQQREGSVTMADAYVLSDDDAPILPPQDPLLSKLEDVMETSSDEEDDDDNDDAIDMEYKPNKKDEDDVPDLEYESEDDNNSTDDASDDEPLAFKFASMVAPSAEPRSVVPTVESLKLYYNNNTKDHLHLVPFTEAHANLLVLLLRKESRLTKAQIQERVVFKVTDDKDDDIGEFYLINSWKITANTLRLTILYGFPKVYTYIEIPLYMGTGKTLDTTLVNTFFDAKTTKGFVDLEMCEPAYTVWIATDKGHPAVMIPTKLTEKKALEKLSKSIIDTVQLAVKSLLEANLCMPFISPHNIICVNGVPYTKCVGMRTGGMLQKITDPIHANLMLLDWEHAEEYVNTATPLYMMVDTLRKALVSVGKAYGILQSSKDLPFTADYRAYIERLNAIHMQDTDATIKAHLLAVGAES